MLNYSCPKFDAVFKEIKIPPLSVIEKIKLKLWKEALIYGNILSSQSDIEEEIREALTVYP